jgi:uncharacterized membrane protein YbjE (DUF340 family)
MSIVFASLIIGGIIGYLDIVPEMTNKKLNNLTTFGLIVLLFSMGTKIGSNQEVLSMIKTISLQAFMLAAGAVFGSIVAVKIVSNVFIRQQSKGDIT